MHWLAGTEEVVDVVEDRGEPYLTSTVCIYEVLAGRLGSGSTDVISERQAFGGVRSLDLTEGVVLEAARIQDELLSAGEPMSARDVMIAATAKTTGDELLVVDSDFDTKELHGMIPMTVIDVPA